MLEEYEEFIKRLDLKDCKASWIRWKMEVYKYPKDKARKRAESQYYPIPTENYQQSLVGLNIKYLREKANLNQLQLMMKLELNDHMLVSRWESGIYLPDASQVKLLADYFNVSQSDLLLKDLRKEMTD